MDANTRGVIVSTERLSNPPGGAMLSSHGGDRMRAFVLFFLATILLPAAFAQDEHPAASEEPIAFGIISGNTGCVIFREFRKTSGMFYGVAVSTKTITKLEVIESQNYTLDRKQWDETQMEDVNELQRIATKDRIKFVKIPNKKPTKEQLEKARAMCKAPV